MPPKKKPVKATKPKAKSKAKPKATTMKQSVSQKVTVTVNTPARSKRAPSSKSSKAPSYADLVANIHAPRESRDSSMYHGLNNILSQQTKILSDLSSKAQKLGGRSTESLLLNTSAPTQELVQEQEQAAAIRDIKNSKINGDADTYFSRLGDDYHSGTRDDSSINYDPRAAAEYTMAEAKLMKMPGRKRFTDEQKKAAEEETDFEKMTTVAQFDKFAKDNAIVGYSRKIGIGEGKARPKTKTDKQEFIRDWLDKKANPREKRRPASGFDGSSGGLSFE
jgi:hypothetical protein